MFAVMDIIYQHPGWHCNLRFDKDVFFPSRKTNVINVDADLSLY